MKSTILFIGPPGCGKGTQAAMLVTQMQYVHVSTGDIVRKEIKSGSVLGQQLAADNAAGILTADEIVCQLLKEELVKLTDAPGIIIDGFPRTLPQVKLLEDLLKTLDCVIEHAFCFDQMPKQILVDRLLARGKVSQRPDDQDPKIIFDRLAIYEQETLPIVQHYKNVHVYRSINGCETVEEVFSQIKKCFGENCS